LKEAAGLKSPCGRWRPSRQKKGKISEMANNNFLILTLRTMFALERGQMLEAMKKSTNGHKELKTNV
jgi:hypothetical protein